MRIMVIILASFFLTGFSVSASEQVDDVSKITSLNELLQSVQNFEKNEQQVFSERIARFQAEKSKQAKQLGRIKKEYKKKQALSKKLTANFEDNEKQIVRLKARLEKQSGNLNELFGVVKQVSGDLRANFQNSYITPQYPQRLAVVDGLAKAQSIPDISKLSALWYEIQREMTATGEVIQYDTLVIDKQGEENKHSILRVGDFSAFWQGQYLVPQKSQPGFVELSSQPEQDNHTSNILTRSESLAPVMVSLDPSRGVILSLLLQKPNFLERVEQGGYIGYVIIAIGAVGILIALARLLMLSHTNRKIIKQLSSEEVDISNPLGRVLSVFNKNRHLDIDALELKLDEEILRNLPRLEKGISTVKVLAAVAPLLGLLGTVVGMIHTFQAITLFGAGDAKLMAGGISEALVTTMLGLIVAVPLILAHSMLSSRSRRLIKTIEEQSTGYIARHAEGLSMAA